MHGPDQQAWDAVVDRVVASLGRPMDETDEAGATDETDDR
jgi:hypothetical protein